MSFRIETIWAYLAVGEDDEEGVIGTNMHGSWLPFVAADRRRLDALRPIAVAIGQMSGKQITLTRFDARTDEEVIV